MDDADDREKGIWNASMVYMRAQNMVMHLVSAWDTFLEFLSFPLSIIKSM